VLPLLEPGSVDGTVTSPPYWQQRDYGHAEQMGLEADWKVYVANLSRVFGLVQKAMVPTGVLWLNLGDTYNGYFGNQRSTSLAAEIDNRPAWPKGYGLRCPGVPNKTLMGIPWRVAFALQEEGWILRADNVWHKHKPESRVFDRPTRTHEFWFLFSRQERYFYDQSEGKHRGIGTSVWAMNNRPRSAGHTAAYSEQIANACVASAVSSSGLVLDPFAGSGTTGRACKDLGRKCIMVEIEEKYCKIAANRLKQEVLF